jgi:hypothetical protein
MNAPPPRGTQPTQYRRPKKLNVVSLTMFLWLGALAYAIYSTWPVVTLRLRVKGDLEDVMNRYWRANLRGEAAAREEIGRLRKELTAKLATEGVTDKKLDFVFERDKKRISIEARFKASVTFPIVDKTIVFDLAPRAETDAAQVDW